MYIRIFTYVYISYYAGTSAVTSLVIGNVVRRIIDANPSLCVSKNLISADTVNATDVDSMQFDYPDCPASVDIAITMTFVYALIMVGTNKLIKQYSMYLITQI